MTGTDHEHQADPVPVPHKPTPVATQQSDPSASPRAESEADVLFAERTGGRDLVIRRMVALQQSSGNRSTRSMLARQSAPPQGAQADPTQGAQQGQGQDGAVVDYDQLANDYEADAQAYWIENMQMELEAASGSEGAAIGRRAGVAAAAEIRKTCEPYEEDQENDTNVLNTVFVVTGGALTVSEGKTSGTAAGGSGTANMTSRAVRAAMGILWMWLPTLAGYKTVGALKAAASRQAEESGAQAGEGGSAAFGGYQTEALKQLKQDFDDDISKQKRTIIADKVGEPGIQLAKSMFPTFRSKYIEKLRKEYGASSPVGTAVQESVVSSMAPVIAQLTKALDDAKKKRQSTQQKTSIIGGILGGAVTGAVIGGAATSWTGPGALIGAGIGAVAGGIIGGIGALLIGD
jgi:hypothetical protein